MLSGAVNLFTAEFDSPVFFLFFFHTHKILKINLKSSRGKDSALMKQSTFQRAWQKDRKLADDSEKNVTYSNCRMKKLTDAGLKYLM